MALVRRVQCVAPSGSVSSVLRIWLRSHRRRSRAAPRARFVVEAIHPALREAIAPCAGRCGTDTHLDRDLLVVEPSGRSENDTRPLRQRLRCAVCASAPYSLFSPPSSTIVTARPFAPASLHRGRENVSDLSIRILVSNVGRIDALCTSSKRNNRVPDISGTQQVAEEGSIDNVDWSV